MEILRVLRILRMCGLFSIFKFHETISEIEYAMPLAANRLMSCDLGFCPKLE